ncbi:unnamed protein product [Brachionus calyciflorus]|uniref:Wbp11/ELF5/Saf1 N-terminal domain-containing protein n=1 Tax=Brachionus calyciflorus TaxID=104777 RepID=A0A814BM94_9BILA|nr:unnamed protein product [Brachionus calyciflorus]
MGKRSTSSTKSGKFMNPTDQARKQERRKELKKNKLQRKIVREAVIKQKDPRHILESLDNLDRLEYDTNNPPPYSATVIQEKRRKLKSELKRIIEYYHKEDPKQAYELKQMESDYDRRSLAQKTFHESIEQAKKVKVEEIPLPDSEQPSDPTPFLFPFGLPPPPPPPTATQVKSILKTSDFVMPKFSRDPPGPPSGPPPDLSEFHLDSDEYELGLSFNEQIPTDDKNKKIRFAPEPVQSIPLPQLMAQVQPPPPPSQAYLPPVKQTIYNPNLQAKIQQQAELVKQQIYQQSSQKPTSAQSSTIEAKPVLRNKVAEVTRFVPTSVIVRRPGHEQQQQYKQQEQTRPYDYTQRSELSTSVKSNTNIIQSNSNNNKSTDAAYEDFMKEVSELL